MEPRRGGQREANSFPPSLFSPPPAFVSYRLDCLIDFFHRKLEHAIGFDGILIHEFVGSLDAGHGDSVSRTPARPSCAAVRESVWEREILRKKPQLSKNRALIPSNMLVE